MTWTASEPDRDRFSVNPGLSVRDDQGGASGRMTLSWLDPLSGVRGCPARWPGSPDPGVVGGRGVTGGQVSAGMVCSRVNAWARWVAQGQPLSRRSRSRRPPAVSRAAVCSSR